jgi:ketosteroid isomerase-like protein
LVASLAYAGEEQDRTIHEELRGLLQGIEQAVNTEQYENMAPLSHEHARITTINQEVISSRPEIAAYFKKWFGPGGYLKKLDMTLTADAVTELYGDKTFGIVRGAGAENYILADGRYIPMKTRWTATVIRDADSKWRILSLHIGTNFLDNPILSKAEGTLMYAVAGGLVIGLGFGGLLVFLIMRRKKAV